MKVSAADGVARLRVKALQAEFRDQRAALVPEAVREQHGLLPVLRKVHQAVAAALVIGRADAVEVALHHDVAVLLVAGDGPAGELPLLVGHLPGLKLHAEASGAGHVEAELDGRDVARLVVGRGRDVRTHGHGRVEEARAVLDAGPRKRFGVVAGPHFVEVFHCAELHAAAARGAGLDQHIGIFGPNAFHDLIEALRIIDPEMRLFVLGQVLRPCIFDVAVGIPLDIVDIGREFHRIVEYREDEILHLRIAQIEKPLVAHTGYFAVARLHDPVGMFLGQFASGVHHLRLDPDTEFHPLLVGVFPVLLRQLKPIFPLYMHYSNHERSNEKSLL